MILLHTEVQRGLILNLLCLGKKKFYLKVLITHLRNIV